MTQENTQEELKNSLEQKKSYEKLNNPLDQISQLKTEVVKQNGLLSLVDKFEKSPLFETQSLKAGEFIFKEGDINNNLYILKKGVLSVEKYTTTLKDSVKQLAVLRSGDFLGEGSISKGSSPKEVSIRALENSEILKIDAKHELKKYIEENPIIGYELLKHVIVETNKRLLEANKMIASNYEIEKTINALNKIDLKSIFGLIDKIKDIVDVDYIIYLEKHPVMDGFLQLKYDSRFKNKLQEKVFERKGNFLDLDELYTGCNIKKDDSVIVNKISIGDEIYGYLLIGREKRSFDGSDKKIFSSITNSLAGILKKFISDKDLKNQTYISEMKNY